MDAGEYAQSKKIVFRPMESVPAGNSFSFKTTHVLHTFNQKGFLWAVYRALQEVLDIIPVTKVMRSQGWQVARQTGMIAATKLIPNIPMTT
ncbi:hypothetical protein ALQ65_200135 [Pseudomonas syringae pv. coriandricola]|uniref:Uncharacterized protein n=1 Tax=Pseudomonas syringae pv. coriandricola TaxID=264453 RepID=A0A3M3JIC9_9PSED|nr:hypothetical protein ALQ65_200135 [Pseudomonas syringae pv. coriandricola]